MACVSGVVGDIEKRAYGGLYCTACEGFWYERDLTPEGLAALLQSLTREELARMAVAAQTVAKPDATADVARIAEMWQGLLAKQDSQGLLFGGFTVADAFYAPVCMRLSTYALPVPPDVAAYIARVKALPGVKAWIDGALAERDFLDFEEPYRTAP